MAKSNAGAFYLFLYTLTVLVYSMVMRYIFYHLPARYKLVAYNRRGDEKVEIDVEKANIEDANISNQMHAVSDDDNEPVIETKPTIVHKES